MVIYLLYFTICPLCVPCVCCVNCPRARARTMTSHSPPSTVLHDMPCACGLELSPAPAPTCVWSLITFVVNFVTIKAAETTTTSREKKRKRKRRTSMSLQKLKFAFNSRSALSPCLPVLSFRFLFISRLTFYIYLTFFFRQIARREREGER